MSIAYRLFLIGRSGLNKQGGWHRLMKIDEDTKAFDSAVFVTMKHL